MPREVKLPVLIGLEIIVFSILFPVSFPTFSNFAAIARNLAFDGIMATGMMILLVAGTFDLSIGGMFSMIGVIAGWLMKQAALPMPIAALTALGAAALGGWINGVIVTKARVNALIATLGTMGIFRGIAVLLGGPGINFLPQSFCKLGQTVILGIQSPVWVMLLIVLLFQLLMKKMLYFRQYYYIGSNPRAAFLSGINVPRLQTLGFVLMGLLAGLSGMLFASRVGTSVSIAGDGAELRVITAVILGGASLTGGKGTVWGAITGVSFIALLNNILIISSISTYWQTIITGGVLVLAVAMDRLSRNP